MTNLLSLYSLPKLAINYSVGDEPYSALVILNSRVNRKQFDISFPTISSFFKLVNVMLKHSGLGDSFLFQNTTVNACTSNKHFELLLLVVKNEYSAKQKYLLQFKISKMFPIFPTCLALAAEPFRKGSAT